MESPVLVLHGVEIRMRMCFDSVHHNRRSGSETHLKEGCSWCRRRLDAGRTWLVGLMVFVGLAMVMIVLYHLAENDYSFDALQAYCFGINIKL